MSSKFTIILKGYLGHFVKIEGITLTELQWAFAELERIAEKNEPDLDYTIEPIAQTDDEWYRQKPEQATFRTVIVFEIEAQKIIVHAIMRRDEHTYDRIAALYRFTKSRGGD